MDTGDVLQKLIDARGISVRELARRLKAAYGKGAPSSPTIGRWLNGSSDPRLSELQAVAKFFDVPLSTLAGGEREEDIDADEQTALDLYREIRAFLGPATALRHLAKVATLAADGGLNTKTIAVQNLTQTPLSQQPQGVVGRSAEPPATKRSRRTQTG